jgi:4-amino-4-deoxy-L-arabinose transferase-like glycosyltransferase
LADKPSAFNGEGLLAGIAAKKPDLLTLSVDAARQSPGRVLIAVLAAHLVIWTLLPIPLSPNLQLDLAEGLALGKEWQIGYWKHPPLPWWVTDLIYRITGTIYSVYALGPLAAVVCMLGIYFLARDIVGPVQALIPVLALEGIHYYNFSAVKFAHDQMQLPIWAWAGFFLYRALVRGHALYWIAAGAVVALAFWTKYSAVIFGLSLGLFLVFDPQARRAWRTPGPYLMGLAFLVTISPHLVWLIENPVENPFRYAELRARPAGHWYEFITFPLRWIGGQLFFVLPALGLLWLAHGPQPVIRRDDERAFARRYVTVLGFVPFTLVTLSSLLTGRLPVLLWGYPLWSFMPLALCLWLAPVTGLARQKSFAAGFAAIFAAMPVLYAAVPLIESTFRDRTQAIHFPGQAAADYFTRVWHEQTNAPLVYVSGEELASNSIAVYSQDRPRVVIHGTLEYAPWIDINDVRRKGVLVVWTDGSAVEKLLPRWEKNFGFAASDTAVVELPMQSRRAKTVRLRYAIVPPRP